MRLQLALNVRDIEEAVDYYQKLFGVAPHKREEGYANFSIEAPPLKLVLFENPDAPERLNHLGVEVSSEAEVGIAGDRWSDAGIVEAPRGEETCCHATQDKVWSREPQGLCWEWYRITDDAPQIPHLGAPASGQCCGPANNTCCT